MCVLISIIEGARACIQLTAADTLATYIPDAGWPAYGPEQNYLLRKATNKLQAGSGTATQSIRKRPLSKV